VELKTGYQRTEAGDIPDDWSVGTVREFSDIKTGPFGTMLKASEYSATGVPLISVGEIRDGRFDVRAETPRIPLAVVRRLPQYVLRKGDIVFARKGGVERSARVEDAQAGWFLGSDGIRLRPRSQAVSEFLAVQLRAGRAQKYLHQHSIGTTMPSLNNGVLGSLPVSVPPTGEEMTAIARVLSDADALIESLEQLLAKKRLIKQGAMQTLLTGTRRIAGFAAPWTVRRFSELATPRKAKVDPRTSGPQPFCIELEHIGAGTGVLNGSVVAGKGASLKTVFEPGDVLFGKLRAYLKKYWRADRRGVCSTEIWALGPNSELVGSEYLFQVVQTSGFIKAATEAYGTHMPRSDWNVVKNYELPIPDDPKEQAAVAATLSGLDAEMSALEAKLAKARLIKQGMMQNLLTGKIRLV